MAKTTSQITIKELAALANVSPATVSRVINRSGYVSKKVSERVERKIAEINYRPDTRARALRGMKSKIIALLIPDILNVYYTALAKSIERSLREKGYIMVLGVTNDVSEVYIHYLNQFWDMQVDGILYVPPPIAEAPSIARSFYYQGMPMVELNRLRETDIFDAVVADNFGGVKQGMKYLLDMGHKKIALVSGPLDTTTGMMRLEGYKFSLTNAGIPLLDSLIKIGQFNKEFGNQAARELLTCEDKPTAIFSGNNRILMGVMTYLINEGYRVPDDISILAFDDSEWCEFSQPPITTIDIAVDNMANLAVDLMIKRITNGEQAGDPMTYTLSTNLKERQSCKKLD